MQELLTLKTIAETLNRSTDLEPMLDEAVRNLLSVTGLTAGWIFLTDEKPSYQCVAACNLPPALNWEDHRPMREGNCWCLADLWAGDLTAAVNVMNCKRLKDAATYKWGDTWGIEHHATVPLKAYGEPIGLLNVGAPGKDRFDEDELALLAAVAYQISTAIERVRLYQQTQRRAELLARLGEVTRRLGEVLAPADVPVVALREAGAAFGWPASALMLAEGGQLSLRAVWEGGQAEAKWARFGATRADAASLAYRSGAPVLQAKVRARRRGLPAARAAAAVPIRLRGEVIGVLWAGGDRPFAEADVEVMQTLAGHAALALENARLYQQRRDLALTEERHRLARDLHDSVCQTLFSLSLTARGAALAGAARAARARTGGAPALAEALHEVQALSQDALREMRSLIWQLRPAGLEAGLTPALARHAESLGLRLQTEVSGTCDLPRAVEEALWRIGQEALNNVSKHAGVDQASLRLTVTANAALLEVADRGAGYSTDKRQERPSLGMTSMRERAEALGGRLSVESRPGAGTRVTAWIPYARREGAAGDGHSSTDR